MLTQNKLSGKMSTRIKNSTKPQFIQHEPHFYRCSCCGQVLVQICSENQGATIQCCGEILHALSAHSASDALAEQHLPTMTISGGFESNTLTVNVGAPPHPMSTEHHLEWIYIYTFQGGQFQFLRPGALPEATFALAGNDAYVYCDRPVCKGNRCKFNCKRGFTAYSWCNQHGLWKLSF